jgi:hypothetical protein
MASGCKLCPSACDGAGIHQQRLSVIDWSHWPVDLTGRCACGGALNTRMNRACVIDIAGNPGNTNH